MNRYPSYKPSGVKWLGEIPSHWEVLPGLAIFKENKEKNSNLALNTVLSLSYGKIVVKKDIDEGLVPAEYNTYQIVHPGYIIIRCTDLQNDKLSLRTGLVKDDGIITGAYLGLMTNEKYNSSYIHYFLHAWDITKEIYRHGNGLRQSLSWLDLRRLPILIPPFSEQTAIANYLDTVTAKIDAAIAQQQKMIDLLNERKQIIINRAVTRGLNPNARMKDSDVEWIGEVPEGWEVRKLKHIARLQSGDTISSDSFTEEGYPVFGGNGFRGYTSRYTNDGDYVLIGRQGALCGNVNYAHGQFFASEHAVVVYPYNKENLVWLGEVIRASNLNQYSQSAAQPGLAVSMIQNISYPYPPEKEREKIASFLKNHLSQIDIAIANCQNQISLLQERKQIIINEVVTGKVKVV